MAEQKKDSLAPVNIIDQILTNKESVKNVIGWAFSPLPQVGSPVGDLKTTPLGMDSASKIGCKSQSYTTWNCMSRTYVGGAYFHPHDGASVTTPAQHRIRVPDTPTKVEEAKFSAPDMVLYKKGIKFFVRGEGLVTQHQLAKLGAPPPTTETTPPITKTSTKHPDLTKPLPPLVEKNKESLLAGISTQPPPPADMNLGYYYTELIPVRSVSVSTAICQRETTPMPYSPSYQSLAGRLNDPAQTGVLSSVIRGPNVRDSMSLTSFVKAMMLRPSTRYDIAPMVRVGAMNLSVATESYECDPIKHRFVRKVDGAKPGHIEIQPKPNMLPLQWQAVAMALDTFTALANNSFNANSVEGFDYLGLDNDWVAVPVPSKLLGQSHLLAYLFAHLSSDAWSGTSMYKVETTRTGPGGRKYRSAETYLPVVNNVDIPGVRRVCLVLIDEAASHVAPSIRLSMGGRSVLVPVWKGEANAPRPVSIYELWERFWRTENINVIRRDTVLAFDYIAKRHGVEDACGTSLSVLSELYGQWYQGIAPPHRGSHPDYDYEQPPYGSWTYDGTPLDKTGRIKSYLFDMSQTDRADARKRAMAYNFSGNTPQHLYPTGYARARYVSTAGYLNISWASAKPDVAFPSYNVQAMNSIFRVGVSLGLVLTSANNYRFGSSVGFVHWVHMLANALSFSMSSFLTVNDITPREWAGIYGEINFAYKENLLTVLKDALFGGIIVHHNITTMYANLPDWDMDTITEYWLISPYNNVDWMTFSPVPSHCTKQWIDKMMLTGGQVPKGVTTFMYLHHNYMALKITRECNEHKFLSVSTIDMYRRYPSVLLREPGEGYVPVLHWIDNVAAYSTEAASKYVILPPNDMYESLTFCASIHNIGVPYSDVNTWYVIGSNYDYNDATLYDYRVTPVQWPDPPILDTLWQGAKNYILKPAASSLAGFLTGGPAGAAIAGASHIASQIVSDLTPTDKRDVKLESSKNMADIAKQVLGEKDTNTKQPQPTAKPVKSQPGKETSNPSTSTSVSKTANPASQPPATSIEVQPTQKKKENKDGGNPVPEPMRTLVPEEIPASE